MAPKRNSARISAADPALLDRRLVSTAEGMLPTHTRISVLLPTGWESGLITGSHTCLNGDGKATIMYRVQYESGKEQETDLSTKDARLLGIDQLAADTPRSQRKSMRTDASAPTVGVTNIPSPSRLGEFKVADLRRMCTDLGLEAKGNKKEIIDVLARAHGTAKAMLAGVPPPAGAAGAEADERFLTQEEECHRLEELVTSLRGEMSSLQHLNDATASAHAKALDAASEAAAAEHTALEAALTEVHELRAKLVEAEARELRLMAELHELKGNVQVRANPKPILSSAGPYPRPRCPRLLRLHTRHLHSRCVPVPSDPACHI